MGLNTNNMDQEFLKYVDRRIENSILKIPLKSKDTAHPEDQAAYPEIEARIEKMNI